jgi:phosphatidylinositol-3-phosphatase
VFVILMENENWSDIYQSAQAPYINGLLSSAQTSYATNYFENPDADHPSEPNYVWLEAATDKFSDDDDSFSCDCDPSATNSTASTAHLATLLTAKGLSWREYAEGITSGTCPVASSGQYACKHVPFIFFQDIVGSPPSATSANCGPHMFAFSDLAGHLTSGNVAAYNFITPNLCDDMHGNTGCPATAEITQGDTWLQNNLPVIMASDAYKNGGAIFITWDESEGGEFPIGMIVISPFAKGHGYNNALKYFHSSTVRTVQEIFGLTPLLADAANQLDLSDLFSVFP